MLLTRRSNADLRNEKNRDQLIAASALVRITLAALEVPSRQ